MCVCVCVYSFDAGFIKFLCSLVAHIISFFPSLLLLLLLFCFVGVFPQDTGANGHALIRHLNEGPNMISLII